MSKLLQILLATVVVVQTALLVVVLIFVVRDVNKADQLDRFFNTVSEDYRIINNGEIPVAAPAVVEDTGSPCIDLAQLDLQDEPTKGSSSAQITIVEYSDFECPFCARFYRDTYNRLIEEYVDSGHVRFIYKDFPLASIHSLAIPTAVAANCVLEELGTDSFFAFHDIVYDRQPQLSESSIAAWTQEVGLSESQLESCRNSAALEEEILEDMNEGSRHGVTGTPAFFINGRLLVGAQPFQAFQSIIEDVLNGEDICSS